MIDGVKIWKIVRRLFLWIFAGAGGLLLLVVALNVEERWRAKRHLSRYDDELKARGEKLDLSSFIPPPVPDAENFATAPLLAPIFKASRDQIVGKGKPRDPALERLRKVNVDVLSTSDSQRRVSMGDYEIGKAVDLIEWQRYFANGPQQNAPTNQREAARAVIAWLGRWSSELDEFSAAAARPRARFPLDYAKGWAMPLPHVGFLMHFSKAYCLRANAALEAGDLDLAFRDLKTLDRTQAAIGFEPLLISHLVRLVVIRSLMQPLWQGLVEHRWRDNQLQQIDAILSHVDLLADYVQGIRAERAFANDMYNRFRGGRRRADSIISEDFSWLQQPSPKWYWTFEILSHDAVMCRNQAWSERWVQDRVLPTVDVTAHRFHPTKEKKAAQVLQDVRTTPYNLIAKIGGQAFSTARRTAAAQVVVEEARVACALERFRLQAGDLPKTLDVLVPNYLSAVPHDMIDGKPLRYRRESDATFTLYSIGWNEVDDGGVIVKKAGKLTGRENEQGDWVWPSAEQK